MKRKLDTLNRFAVGASLDGRIHVHLAAPRGQRGVRSLTPEEAINLAAWLIVMAKCAEVTCGRYEIPTPGGHVMPIDDVRALVEAIEAT